MRLLLAERLSAKYSAIIGSRSLELLLVAAALEAKATHFTSLDIRQRQVAALNGLKILPGQKTSFFDDMLVYPLFPSYRRQGNRTV